MTEFWDRIGISASLLCAIHCLLTPFLIFLVPFVGNAFADHWFHFGIATIVFPVAIWALWNGYRRHRVLRVLLLGVAGLALMAGGMSVNGVDSEGHLAYIQIVLMVAAGLTLSSAHYLNLRECRRRHGPHRKAVPAQP